MSQTTSSRSYNILALRGASIDDMEYVDRFDLPENVAYTPQINQVMLDRTYQENIQAGVDEKTAKANRREAEQNIKRLLASKGMLK